MIIGIIIIVIIGIFIWFGRPIVKEMAANDKKQKEIAATEKLAREKAIAAGKSTYQRQKEINARTKAREEESIANGDKPKQEIERASAAYYSKIPIELDKETSPAIIGAYRRNINLLLYHDGTVAFEQSEHPKNRYLITGITDNPVLKTETTVKGRTGSALVGGLVAGPVGAIVGASRKRKVEQTVTDLTTKFYVHFTDSNKQRQFTLAIAGNNETASAFQKAINS